MTRRAALASSLSAAGVKVNFDIARIAGVK